MTSPPRESILMTLGERARGAGEQIGARWSGKWKRASYGEILPSHRYRKRALKKRFSNWVPPKNPRNLGTSPIMGGCRVFLYVPIGVRRPSPRPSLLTRGSGRAWAGGRGGGVKFGSVSRNIPGGERGRGTEERVERRRRRYRLANILSISVVRLQTRGMCNVASQK